MIFKVIALVSLIGMVYHWSHDNILGVVACGFLMCGFLLLDITEK